MASEIEPSVVAVVINAFGDHRRGDTITGLEVEEAVDAGHGPDIHIQ